MRAELNNYRQAPRKVRLVADLVRGKGARQALIEMNALPKRAAFPLKKLLASAIANAKQNFGVSDEQLFIKEIHVEKGYTIKRSMPRAMGRATPINKRTSRISLILGQKESKLKNEKSKSKIKVPPKAIQ